MLKRLPERDKIMQEGKVNMNLQPWQVHQKHEKDLRQALKETGDINPQGHILKFIGQKFWPFFESLGHDKCSYQNCKCFAGYGERKSK
jgi:hypothetical protein